MVKNKWDDMETREKRNDEQGKRTVKILKLLLSHGADPNERDGSGATALFDAARRGPIRAVKILLQFGSDSLMKNDSNQTPEIAARQQKQVENEKLLKQWQALIEPHKKAEFLSEWKSFLDDVDIPIGTFAFKNLFAICWMDLNCDHRLSFRSWRTTFRYVLRRSE